MDPYENALAKFFGVVLKGQTYANILYLLLSFPLGIFYFTFLVTGLSLGVGLAILWVGLFILLAVYAGWYALIAFERQMAIAMLGEQIPPMVRQDLTGKTLWQKFTATLTNPVTWKGLAYLFIKFPLGILNFVGVVTLGSISLALIAAPFYYHWFPAVINLGRYGSQAAAYWVIDSLDKALIACLIGILVGVASLHVFNGLALVSGRFARYMLGDFSPAPAATTEVVTTQA
jgi:hypothetical protein